ncbi:MAG: transcription elongation factor GreA [Alphaproteobacteria bacterium]|jgi:transcription elongation factor GreA
MDKLPMTTEGHQTLQEELRNLKSVERPNIVKAIAAAREHGDLSENAEYHAARERQSFIEGRIGELEDAIKRAEVIDTSKLKGKVVRFGATVKVADEETDEEITYQLVGELEADIQQRKISIGSPLGRALIGREIGDSVEVTTPNGVRYFEVINVRFK